MEDILIRSSCDIVGSWKTTGRERMPLIKLDSKSAFKSWMGEDGDKLEVIFSCSPTSPWVYEAYRFNEE